MAILTGVRVIPHCGFDLHFSFSDVELFGHLYVFFEKISISVHFLSGLFDLELHELLVYFRLIPVSHFICKYFLPFCLLDLSMDSFAAQKLLSLTQSHLCLFFSLL